MKSRPKETNNVCNMPEVASITIHRSEETGNYYVEFINHEIEGASEFGLWTQKYFTKEEAIGLMKCLSEKRDAE